MAMFKPSNFEPSLSEIDVTKDNTFTAQVNTSGEPAKAYKLTIMSGDASEVLYEPETPTNLNPPVKNKAMLSIPNVNSTTIPVLQNDKDYQWGVRVYNQEAGAATQPNTLVCDGYIVGSTKYVTWIKVPNHGKGQANQNIADNLIYDRFIEYTVTNANQLMIGAHEDKTVEKPTGISVDTPYTQRRKIDWVDKELGTNKDYIKIETDKHFDFDYVDGTEFQIYQCSDEHTVKSAFADPNSNINVSNVIVLYETVDKAYEALQLGEFPDGQSSKAWEQARKIVGYSSDTGEIRVHDPWESAPANTYAYRIFEQDVSTKLYKELFSPSIKFTAPTGAHYYGTVVNAGTEAEKQVPYYSDPGLTDEVGKLTINTNCTFIKMFIHIM